MKKRSTILLLYKILIRSKLEYACVIWNTNKITHIDQLERVQKKFVKFFYNKFKIKYSTDDYRTLCQELNLPLLGERRLLFDACFLYKLVNNMIDCPSLLEQVHFHVPTTTRRKDLFYVSSARVDVRKNSLIPRAMKTYNTATNVLPDLDTSMTYNEFHRCVSKLTKIYGHELKQ